MEMFSSRLQTNSQSEINFPIKSQRFNKDNNEPTACSQLNSEQFPINGAQTIIQNYEQNENFSSSKTQISFRINEALRLNKANLSKIVYQHRSSQTLNSYMGIFLILLFFSMITSVESAATLVITSNQAQTGVLATYYFAIQGHSNPNQIILNFTDWSPTVQQPFIGGYVISENNTGNSLSCFRIGQIISCPISASIFSGSVYPATIALRMTNIYNPSSMKPYPIEVTLKNSTDQLKVVSTLTAQQPRSQVFTLVSYSTDIGRKSESTLWFPFRNYQSSATILNVTYNSAIVGIDLLADTTYTKVTDTAGLKRVTGWTSVSQSSKQLKVNVTNPSFAVQFTIDGMLYFVQGGVQYKIAKYTVTVQVNTLSYTTLSTVSPQNNLKMGVTSNTLSLSSQCSIASINSPTRQSYFTIQYNNSIITIDPTSTCGSSTVLGDKTTCTLSIPTNTANFNNTISLTQIKSLIQTTVLVSSVRLKVSSWSYFSVTGQFYQTCAGNLDINVVPQTLALTSTLATCNQLVGAVNTLTIQGTVEGVAALQTITIKGYAGKIVNKTGSMTVTQNSTSNSYESQLISSQIPRTSFFSIAVSFQNPTHLPSTTPSIQVYLSQKLTTNSSQSNIIAQTSLPFSLCPVTSVLSNSSNTQLSLADTDTYQKRVTYSVQLSSTSIQFKDYALNDYLIVGFRNKVTSGSNTALTDSPYQLSSYSASIAPTVTLNTQYLLKSEVVNSSSLKIMLNSSIVVNLINNPLLTPLNLNIESLSNPYFKSDVFLTINAFTALNQQKQTFTTTSVPLIASISSQLSMSTSSIITLLQTNNTIMLTIQSQSQKSLLSVSYSFIPSISFTIKSPFPCTNLNATNELTVTLASLNTTETNITLTNCTVGYFQDYTRSIEVTEYAKFSHSSFSSYLSLPTTSSSLSLKSTCGDQCRYCEPSTLQCTACFSSAYSVYNYFYATQNKCYEKCPSGTYNSGLSCIKCHPLCKQCTGPAFNSCTSCATGFTMNTEGLCQSTCGANMFLNTTTGQCSTCHPNCNICVSQTQCYNCKASALLVSGSCLFSQCQFPCETCQGSISNCLTCVSSVTDPYYLSENSCVKKCPEGQFQWQDQKGMYKCMVIESSNIYFVGVVLCGIALFIGIGIRCCSRKRSKLSSLSLLTQNQRDFLIRTTKLESGLNSTLKPQPSNLSKTQIPSQSLIQNILSRYLESPKQKIYKLNLLRWMTVVMGFVQIVCVVVILVQGGVYNPKGVNEIIAVGLVGLVVTNLTFGVKYFVSVYRKLRNQREKFIQTNLSKEIPPKSLSTSNKNQVQPLQQPEIQIQPPQQPIVLQSINPQPQSPKPSLQLIEQDPQQNNVKKQQSQQSNANLASNPQNPILQLQKLSDHPAELTEEQKQKIKKNKKLLHDFDSQMVKELVIALFSMLFTVRTYNILRSNLFIIFSQEEEKETLMKNIQKLQQDQEKRQDQIANSNSALKLPSRQPNDNDLKKTQLIQSKRNSPLKKGSKDSTSNIVKVQPSKLQKKQSLTLIKKQSSPRAQQPPKILETLPSILSPAPPPTINLLIQTKNQYVNRFLHPFYTYVVFASIILVTLMFAIASAILIFKNRYQNMMIWGIDALVVTSISFFLNIFDLWKAVNLSHNQQHSQMSDRHQEINQTLENLKNGDQDNEKVDMAIVNEQDIHDMNATQKITMTQKKNSSSIKFSPSKKKVSQIKSPKNIVQAQKLKSPKSPSMRSQKTQAFNSLRRNPNKNIGEMSYTDEKPPELKIFDDLQIEDGPQRLTPFDKPQKLQKSTSKSNQFPKIRQSNRTLYGRKTEMSNQLQSQTTRNKSKGHKLEDIFLGFVQNQLDNQKESQRSGQENNEIIEKDQIETVKLQTRDLLHSIKQSSIVNINSQMQIDDNEWRGRSLKLKLGDKANKEDKEKEQRNVTTVEEINDQQN